MDWYTLDTAREDWTDAPADDTILQAVLDAAKTSVLDFDAGYCWRLAGTEGDFPGDYPDGAVPAALVMAHLMQARRVWAASKVQPSTDDDVEFVAQPISLDWFIKQVAHPKAAS